MQIRFFKPRFAATSLLRRAEFSPAPPAQCVSFEFAEKSLAAQPGAFKLRMAECGSAPIHSARPIPLMTPLKTHLTAFCYLRVLHLCFACAAGALQAQSPPDPARDAALEKSARAEIQREAASTRVEDRRTAVDKLTWLYMDYTLLWQLMHDADPGVRQAAIRAMTMPSCTTVADQPLSPELAQKMAGMLEKEVTPERIRAAFAPGLQTDAAATLATTSAITLHHLQQYDSLLKSPAEYSAWQQRVLTPLFLAAAGVGTSSAGNYASMLNLLPLFTQHAQLLQVLPLILQKLDDPALHDSWLLPTLETFWHHPLLGHDRPLHLLLLVQLAPRLPSLRTRILASMEKEQGREQAARLVDEIATAIRTAYEKLPPASAEPR